MTTEPPTPPTSSDAAALATTDLRAALLADLKEQFKFELTSKASVPEAQRNAVLELLNGEIPTASEIVKALTGTPIPQPPTTNG